MILTKSVTIFDYHSLSLTLNGGRFDHFRRDGGPRDKRFDDEPPYFWFGPFDRRLRNYVLTVDPSQIVDYAGNTGTTSESVTWTNDQGVSEFAVASSSTATAGMS